MPAQQTSDHPLSMENYLIVSALGKNNPEDLEQFTRAVRDCGCNIPECRMAVLGSECCIVLKLAGSWDAIAKIEDMLPRLEKRLSMSIMARRSAPAKPGSNLMPYAIDVVSFDRPGIVHDIINFIHDNKLGIQEMHSHTYLAQNTGTPMCSLHMTINIPSDMSIAAIRGDFMEFCDQLNLDAIMEPVK